MIGTLDALGDRPAGWLRRAPSSSPDADLAQDSGKDNRESSCGPSMSAAAPCVCGEVWRSFSNVCRKTAALEHTGYVGRSSEGGDSAPSTNAGNERSGIHSNHLPIIWPCSRHFRMYCWLQRGGKPIAGDIHDVARRGFAICR